MTRKASVRGVHFKIPGVVTAVEKDGSWWARLDIEGQGYEVEMDVPLAPDAREGSLFTIHRTKRGRRYVYWIQGPRLTPSRLKRARKWGREMWKVLGGVDDGRGH